MKTIIVGILVFLTVPGVAQINPVVSGSYHWDDLPVAKGENRESRKFVEGTTAEFDYFEIHATTQFKGAVARPPHAQQDREEVIFVKEGTMKFTVGNKSKVLGKGSVVLIPPLEMQSVENAGEGALSYYVVMFHSKKPMDMLRSAKAGGSLLLNADSLKYVPSARGGGIKYFERPTAMTDNFEMHITELKSKGPSHAPHIHIDTELILVIEGETEMVLGDKTFKASAGDLYIMNSNELHGISNSQDKPCKYFAVRWR